MYSVTFRYTLEEYSVIGTIKHKGLRRLHEKNDRRGLRPDLVDKAQRFFRLWKQPTARKKWRFPCSGFHPFTGDRRGIDSVAVKANWRVTFRFHDGAAHHVNLVDYH